MSWRWMLALAALLALPRSARAQTDDEALAQARQHYSAGKSAYTAGDYAGAIREFKAAELLRPSPVLDYNIGLADQQLGRKRIALNHYRRYLAGMPDAPNRAEVEGRVAALERELAEAPPAPRPSPSAVEQPSDLPPDAPPSATGADPYTPRTAAVAPPVPAPRRNLWWIPLAIVGGVVVVGAIVAGIVLTSGTVNRSAPAAAGLGIRF